MTAPDARPPCPDPAPLYGEPDPEAPAVIVVFRDGVDHRAATEALAARLGFTPSRVYESALPGFAAELTAAQVAAVRCAPGVAYVEHDQRVQLFTARVPGA